MDEKISLEAIALYGDAYADKVLKGFFASKDKITGAEILSLCNVQQINLFVVKELFRAWKEDMKKLKSPYFDYENPEVKESLEQFMAVVSNNILIEATYFAPLLKKAVSQSLLVIFAPYDFFAMLVTGKNNKLEVGNFREEIKYLRVNKAPLERALQLLEQRGVRELGGNEAFALLDEVLEEVNFSPEDVDDYIEKFSTVVPLNPGRFYVSRQPEYKTPTPVQTPPPVAVNVPQTPPAPPPAPAAAPRVNQPKAQAPAVPTAQPLQEKPRDAQRTLADNFQRIARIKDSLTINQKFMFTKVLFHGDFELFSKAIDRLDQLDNLRAALRYIEDEYAATWDRDSEEFHEFMELVEKRFS